MKHTILTILLLVIGISSRAEWNRASALDGLWGAKEVYVNTSYYANTHFGIWIELRNIEWNKKVQIKNDFELKTYPNKIVLLEIVNTDNDKVATKKITIYDVKGEVLINTDIPDYHLAWDMPAPDTYAETLLDCLMLHKLIYLNKDKSNE